MSERTLRFYVKHPEVDGEVCIEITEEDGEFQPPCVGAPGEYTVDMFDWEKVGDG